MIKDHKKSDSIMVEFKVRDMTNDLCLHETIATGDNGEFTVEFNTKINGAPYINLHNIVKDGRSVSVGIDMQELVETLVTAAEKMGLADLLESSKE